MICSSVNLDRFIRPSLPSGQTLCIPGGVLGGQVTRDKLCTVGTPRIRIELILHLVVAIGHFGKAVATVYN
jgi:hypothetical protein